MNFRSLLSIDQEPKSKLIHKFEYDSLIISCAKFNNPNKFLSFSHHFTHDLITENDLKLAEEISDYYSKKIMLWKLLGKPLTKFREDLNTYIHSDRKKIPEEMMGLAYRLPSFYFMDKEYDELKLQFKDKFGPKIVEDRFELTYLKAISNPIKLRKSVGDKEYWFESNNQPYVIKLAKSNPLIHIWDKILEQQTKVVISGKVYRAEYDDFNFWAFDKWSLESI